LKHTLATYAFKQNIYLLLREMEAHQRGARRRRGTRCCGLAPGGDTIGRATTQLSAIGQAGVVPSGGDDNTGQLCCLVASIPRAGEGERWTSGAVELTASVGCVVKRAATREEKWEIGIQFFYEEAVRGAGVLGFAGLGRAHINGRTS
jgi:hypothetical protein